MANNFQVPAGVSVDRYISKNGHDSNDGATPDTPRRTSLASGSSTQINLIGAGQHDFGSIPSGVNNFLSLRGDGKCTVTLEKTSGGSCSFYNMTIRDSMAKASSNRSISFNNCEIEGIELETTQSNSPISISYSVFKFATGAVNMVESRLIIGNSVILSLEVNVISFIELASSLKESYIAEEVVLKVAYHPSDFRNNNFRGVLRFPVTGGNQDYAIQDLYVGTPQDNGYDVGVKWLTEANLTADGYGGTIVGWDYAVSTCINRDPKFIDASRGVFELQPDSPMIGRSIDGLENIGGKEVGKAINPTDNNSETIHIYDDNFDLTVPSQPVLKPTSDYGIIRVLHKVVSGSNPTPVTFSGIIGYKGGLYYDSDFPLGSIQNNNVPSALPDAYPSEKATTGASPDASTVICQDHGYGVGQYFRYAGQDRQIATVPDDDTFTLDAPLRAAMNNLEVFQVGTELQMAALQPNRLEVMWRTSKRGDVPTLDSHWDNDLDPILGYAGAYFPQELWKNPLKFIVGTDVYGNASPDLPEGALSEQFSLVWFETKIKIIKGQR